MQHTTRRRVTLAAASLALLGPHLIAASQPTSQLSSQPASQVTIQERNSLFVRDVGVVDDARSSNGGEWSFGHLMRELSGDVPAVPFVESWISSLTLTPKVNDDPAMNNPALTQAKEDSYSDFFDAWRARSANGVLDLDTAPFRLLAIVNRPDLLKIDNGQVLSAGEARFIYAAVDPSLSDTTSASSGSMRFFVIFEYGIPASSCEDLVAWQQRWQDLSLYTPGSAAYNTLLASITSDVVLGAPSSPRFNGSKLNQLRTNAFQVGQSDLLWDLREWTLQSRSGQPNLATLTATPTKQTPQFRYMRSAARNAELAAWLDSERANILDGSHEVGRKISGPGSRTFVGGLAMNAREAQGQQVPNTPFMQAPSGGTLWWAPGFANDDAAGLIVSEENALVRHRFALQTCSGCHLEETTTQFSMTTTRAFNSETSLSPFLFGTGLIPDPVNPVAIRSVFDPSSGTTASTQVQVNHSFGDLAQRAMIMGRILALDCTDPALGATLNSIGSAIGSRVH